MQCLILHLRDLEGKARLRFTHDLVELPYQATLGGGDKELVHMLVK